MENKKKQFIYVLKLIPHLLDQANWSETEEDIVNRHFNRLQSLLKEGS